MAARVALFYALGACTWIAGSDFLVGITTGSGFTNVALNTGKGFLFVAATGLLLFIVLRRLLRTELEARAQAEATAKQLSEHERALQQSELLYHTIFESANDGILLLENDRFIDCNPRTLEIFRAKREQLIGLTPADLSPERQPDGRLSREIQTETNRLALADKPQVFPWQHRRTDGSSFTAEVSLRRFQLGERKLLLALVRDITERLKGEEAERLVRLQHSALQAAANAIVITDRKGDIQWVNEAFTRLTGYDRNEAIGLKPNILKSGTHGPAFYKNMWEEVLAGRVWQGELTNRRKNGTTYDEEMTITPVRSDHGDITHFIAIKQDVTERKKLEQQFLRSQRMQSIGLLAGGVAHDLNNVLTPVLLALPLLRNPLDPEERERIIESLEQSVRRGANIVQQVLTFARGVEVQRTSVQLRHLIREVARIAEETFPRDIEIRTSLPRDLWTVAGDPTQIHQVVLNLAVNARDALPNGGQLVFTGRNLELEHPRQFRHRHRA
jgi:PAS domain S-box-containing protein